MPCLEIPLLKKFVFKCIRWFFVTSSAKKGVGSKSAGGCNQLLTTSHLLLEHFDHGIEGAGATNFTQHGVQFGLVHELTDIVKSGTEVVLAQGTVLVDVHKLETFLVHVNLLLREAAIVAPDWLKMISLKHILWKRSLKAILISIYSV